MLHQIIHLKDHYPILGENGKNFEYFPILIKLIDAKNDLSVQVHPDNEYAMRVEKEFITKNTNTKYDDRNHEWCNSFNDVDEF